jgi:perosamine synthetase
LSEQIPLARPELGEREEALVLEVLRSGRLSLGPMLERFEREFAAWLGVDDAVAVSSGTTALHLGVRSIGWGRGDIVLTSPLSFVASANCLLYEEAQPVFCDVDPVTLNLDPLQAEALLGHRTAGILPIHLFGYPADMAALEALAGRRRLAILEDACEALGAIDSEGVRVGTRGNRATFAFYANKQMTTAEGGVLVPTAAVEAARARSERNQGRGESMAVLEHERLGFNYRISDVQAAIGVAQLERLDELLTRRAAVAALYQERLAAAGGAPAGEGDPDGLVLPCRDRGEARRSWFVYVIRLPAATERDEVIARLATAGIASKPYLPCIHLQPFYRRRFGHREGQFPVAEEAAARSLALPFFTAMSDGQVERVCEALEAALAA